MYLVKWENGSGHSGSFLIESLKDIEDWFFTESTGAVILIEKLEVRNDFKLRLI